MTAVSFLLLEFIVRGSFCIVNCEVCVWKKTVMTSWIYMTCPQYNRLYTQKIALK